MAYTKKTGGNRKSAATSTSDKYFVGISKKGAFQNAPTSTNTIFGRQKISVSTSGSEFQLPNGRTFKVFLPNREGQARTQVFISWKMNNGNVMQIKGYEKSNDICMTTGNGGIVLRISVYVTTTFGGGMTNGKVYHALVDNSGRYVKIPALGIIAYTKTKYGPYVTYSNKRK